MSERLGAGIIYSIQFVANKYTINISDIDWVLLKITGTLASCDVQVQCLIYKKINILVGVGFDANV